jgi:hypothetical protein
MAKGRHPQHQTIIGKQENKTQSRKGSKTQRLINNLASLRPGDFAFNSFWLWLVGVMGLWVVLLVFVGLSLLYSLIVPITQGEDELAHYRYISFIAQTGRLPINEAEQEQAWYRSDWPPLYHLLVGWAVSPLDTTRPHLKDVGESPRRRLVGEIFYPRLIIYTEDANWPWQDGILAWHIGRFMSILFSAVALVFVYLTTLELCRGAGEQGGRGENQSNPHPVAGATLLSQTGRGVGGRGRNIHLFSSAPLPPRTIATATTALLAFTPRYLFSSAMLSDDSLFILLSASFIWLLLRALRGDDRWWVYARLGFLLGLSIATKYSTGLFPLLIIPVVWWRARQAGWGWFQAAGRVAFSWLFTLLGCSWWFAWLGYYFNTIEEDGPLFGVLGAILATGPDVSMRRVFAFFGGAEYSGQIRPDAVVEGDFGGWWLYLFQTFWGVPVLEVDPLFPWAYLVVLLFCLLALVGLWQFWRITDALTRMTIVMLALVVILLFPFPIVRFFLTFNILETGQGRHILYPAAQAIPILLMLGWGQVLLGITHHTSRNTQYVIRNAYYAPSLLLLLWSIFQLIYMHNTYPDPLPVQTTTFKADSIPQPLKHNFGEAIQFLGYDFQPDPAQAIINLTLYWRAIEQVDENYRTQVQLVDVESGQSHFTWLGHPLNGRYPTRAWDKGDVIRDTLPLPLAAVPANLYDIQIDLLREAEDTSLTGEPLQIIQFTLGEVQPIPNASTLAEWQYRLWIDNVPARYRQTIPLSFQNLQSPISNLQWVLLDPTGQPHHPAAISHATAIFMVEADWPSGEYRLGLAESDMQSGPLFTVANNLRLFDLPAETTYTPVEANFANQVKLLGYSLPARRVEPGGGLPLVLYWQSLAPVLGDYVMFDVLLDEKQQAYGGYDRLPREFYSTMLWAEGEIVEDGFAVPVSPAAPPGVYHLHVGLYSLISDAPVSLPLMRDGQPGDATSVVIGPIKVGGPPPDVIVENPKPQITLNQSFGEQITLLGYNLTDENNQPIQNSKLKTQNLKLTLFWQADAPPNADYTTFVHLRNNANENARQKDQPPANGRYPTLLWDAGEIIVDEIVLPLHDLPPGEYTPVIGLYDFTTGARLPLGSGPDTELHLESITLP